MVNFQNFLLVSAVLFTLGAILILLFWKELWVEYNALLLLVAVTFGVVGFTSLDFETEK